MTRVAVEVHEQDGLLIPPGLYTVNLEDDGAEQWGYLEFKGHASPLLAGLAPNGEVCVVNADLREPGAGAARGWLGVDPLQCTVSCATLGKLTKPEAITLYDGGHHIIRAGEFRPDPDYVDACLQGAPADTSWIEGLDLTLYPNAPGGYLDNGASGSPANHAQWEGAWREAFITGKAPPFAREQANVDGCRPVIGHFGLGDDGCPIPFLGIEHSDATPGGAYRARGGWGLELYGTKEHFGRPAKVLPSPWYPNDYYHFCVHQMIGYAATGSIAAACWVRASFESIWISWKKGKLPAARAYRVFGDIADAALVFRNMGGRWAEYADHLLGPYLAAVLDKLDSESDRLKVRADERALELAVWAMVEDGIDPQHAPDELIEQYVAQEYVAPAFEWNCGERGDSDHYRDTQCIWMSGQLGIGGIRLLYAMKRFGMDGTALYGRLRVQVQRVVRFVVDEAWNVDPNGRGWPEDFGPFGDIRPSSSSAITGKYRQYLAPFLEMAFYWMLAEANRAPTPKARKVLLGGAQRCLARANWLAGAMLEANWFGTSSTPDKGFTANLADAGWLTASRLGVTRDEWAAALGQAQEVG